MRYLARKYKMYGADDTEAALCDMAFEGLCDFRSSKNVAKYMPRYVLTLNPQPETLNP